MYHYVSELPPGGNRLRRDLTVPPDVFEAHLQFLRDAGYTGISLEDLYWHLMTGRPLPEKPVVLTFDDGYRDNYEVAFPLLKKYGFTATFFAITDFVDWGYERYVTWEQLREMQEAGMEIGAHSRDHPDLRDRDIDFLVWQILGPREAIEDHLGKRPRFYSYPSGKYDEKVIAVLRSDHYWGAVTTHQGTLQSSDRPFELHRIRVRGSYEPDDLAWWISYWMTADNEDE
jgi:peptidoglycan/xylan/chitin deacetylase (PgdA/CDA1 family)